MCHFGTDSGLLIINKSLYTNCCNNYWFRKYIAVVIFSGIYNKIGCYSSNTMSHEIQAVDLDDCVEKCHQQQYIYMTYYLGKVRTTI